MSLPEVPSEEMGALGAAAILVIRDVVAELVRRSSDVDRAAIEAMLEQIANEANALNAKQKRGLREDITHHLNSQARLMLQTIRKA